MKHRIVLILFLSVLTGPCFFAVQAESSGSVESQNAAAKHAVLEFHSKFSCPKAVEDKAQLVIQKKNLPILLQFDYRQAMPNQDPVYFLRLMSEMRETLRKHIPSQGSVAANKTLDDFMNKQVDSAANGLGLTPNEVMQLVSRGPNEQRPLSHGLSRPSASITFDNQVQMYCNDECEMDIKWSFVQSIGIWKGLCILCTDDFMSVITDGQHHWVDGRVLAWLSRANKQPIDFSGFPGQSGRLSALRKQESKGGVNPLGLNQQDLRHQAEGLIFYELVEKNSRTQKDLCKM